MSRQSLQRGVRGLATLCALILAACEPLHGGETALLLPLEADGQGGFKSLTLRLDADMAPAALNFHAELGHRPEESGKWNGYRVTLTRAGQVVAAAEFNVNDTGTPELPPAHPAIASTLLVLRTVEGGDHVLSITSAKANEVTLTEPRLEVRRNVAVPLPGAR